jgi:5-methylcytosine-specific restriction endonuclease McrA
MKGRFKPMRNLIIDEDENGNLRHWAWPGGYPLFYIIEPGCCAYCPDCASKVHRGEIEDEEITAVQVNWEDNQLTCEQCHRRIFSAYAEEDTLTDEEIPF